MNSTGTSLTRFLICMAPVMGKVNFSLIYFSHSLPLLKKKQKPFDNHFAFNHFDCVIIISGENCECIIIMEM